MLLVQGAVDAAVAAHGQGLAGMDIAVQGDGGLLAGGNGVDGKAGTGVAVAAHEDIGLGGLIGQLVGLGVALLADLQLAHVQAAPVDPLADGADDGLDLDGLELAGAHGLAAALLVGLAQLHDLHLQAGDLAVLAQDLHGGVEELELHALFHGLAHFLGIGGHLGLGAAVDDVGLLSAQTDRGAADVHGHVAGADDGARACRP